MRTPKASLQQLQALADFRSTLRSFLHFSEEAAIRVGLSPQQHQLLLQIAGAPEGQIISVAYLAQRLALQHHSTVELCKRCEDGGWVTRERYPENRRWVVLRLTQAAEELMSQLAVDHSKELKLLAPRLLVSLDAITNHERGKVSPAQKSGTP